MIHSQSRSPPLSYTVSAERAHHSRSNSTPFIKGHKSSLSKTIPWLGRGSAQYTPTQPLRISEPKFVNQFDLPHAPRSGTLGSGAIVVKTPQDALSAQFYDEEEEHEVSPESEMYQQDRPNNSPESPDLPPLPLEQHVEEFSLVGEADVPPAPTRLPPLAPVASTSATLRPSLKKRSSGHFEYSPPVPRLPANITSAPVPPPFDPILISALPMGGVDSSKIIIALETGTSTHRTTLTTLTSRPSRLSTYLKSLLPQPEANDASVHSHTSEVSTPDSSFNSIFHHHLASSGLLTQASSSIHVFLDRPSAP